MKKGDSRKKTGFTIIEVALVLAIAGLIFLMVFVALPQLQRQQRDSRRRDDILSFLETVKKYQTNNRGALPVIGYDGRTQVWSLVVLNDDLRRADRELNKNNWNGFYLDYLGEDFTDPSGGNYSLYIEECTRDDCSNITIQGYKTISELSDLSFPNANKIYVIPQAECDGATVKKSSNPRKIAALYRLEGAGVYCANT